LSVASRSHCAPKKKRLAAPKNARFAATSFLLVQFLRASCFVKLVFFLSYFFFKAEEKKRVLWNINLWNKGVSMKDDVGTKMDSMELEREKASGVQLPESNRD
jgi:hypothetical protein